MRTQILRRDPEAMALWEEWQRREPELRQAIGAAERAIIEAARAHRKAFLMVSHRCDASEAAETRAIIEAARAHRKAYLMVFHRCDASEAAETHSRLANAVDAYELAKQRFDREYDRTHPTDEVCGSVYTNAFNPSGKACDLPLGHDGEHS